MTMARTIWKFQLNPIARGVVMPVGAKVLTAREQGDTICIWAEVDPDAEGSMRHFVVYGTGHEMPDDPGTYIGTASLSGGRLIFHVYEPVS
jgi:hypothetical protein